MRLRGEREMGVPSRIKRYAGRFALVDDIPFHLPVACSESPALFAIFKINADKAQAFLPGNELFPVRLWSSGLLIVSVMDYRVTTIGRYIEYSVGIACTKGRRRAPRLLSALLPGLFGTGQFVVNLAVSSEISVKGGKGIWGMPKEQGSLDYRISDDTVSSQYDIDGQLGIRITIPRPKRAWLPISVGASNYCAFRGMIWRSHIHFKSKAGFTLFPKGAELLIGTHPKVTALKDLEIDPNPIAVAFIPQAEGVLDDHLEGWFYSSSAPITQAPPGMETVVNLGENQDWPPAPTALGR
jgi:hypothetical protein